MLGSSCDICHRPTVACVCERIVSYPTERRVLILQHPQERDALLGSAQILQASLPKAKIVVGLSWPNLAAALGEESVDTRRWAVLFPDRESLGDRAETRSGSPVDPASLAGIVVLDGTCANVYDFVHPSDLWPARLPHVTRVELSEDESGIQHMDEYLNVKSVVLKLA